MDEKLENFYRQYIGFKVRKKPANDNSTSKPFKSTFKINTIKNVIEHPTRKTPAFIFNEDDTYVSCEGCRIFPLQTFDLSKVSTLYPKSKTVGVEGYTKKGLAWTKLEFPTGISLEEQLLHCIFLGAEAINLKVFHHNTYVYPDYMMTELVTDSKTLS